MTGQDHNHSVKFPLNSEKQNQKLNTSVLAGALKRAQFLGFQLKLICGKKLSVTIGYICYFCHFFISLIAMKHFSLEDFMMFEDIGFP